MLLNMPHINNFAHAIAKKFQIFFCRWSKIGRTFDVHSQFSMGWMHGIVDQYFGHSVFLAYPIALLGQL
jgi:hypothetical protein